MRPYRNSSGALVIDPSDGSWLPPHVPEDVMSWSLVTRAPGHGFVQVCGTQAYEFICTEDGRATDIRAYVDGMCTHHWRRDPIDGTWPGTYEWQAVAVYGQGLVR